MRVYAIMGLTVRQPLCEDYFTVAAAQITNERHARWRRVAESNCNTEVRSQSSEGYQPSSRPTGSTLREHKPRSFKTGAYSISDFCTLQ